MMIKGCSPAYLLRVEKAVWVPINVFSPKWATVGALAVRFRILSKKIIRQEVKRCFRIGAS